MCSQKRAKKAPLVCMHVYCTCTLHATHMHRLLAQRSPIDDQGKTDARKRTPVTPLRSYQHRPRHTGFAPQHLAPLCTAAHTRTHRKVPPVTRGRLTPARGSRGQQWRLCDCTSTQAPAHRLRAKAPLPTSAQLEKVYDCQCYSKLTLLLQGILQVKCLFKRIDV